MNELRPPRLAMAGVKTSRSSHPDDIQAMYAYTW